MKIEQQIQALARKFEAEGEANLNLWTWLPSYKAATRAHGNYAVEHQPSNADVMIEAAMFIADNLNPSPENLKKNEWYHCPCGECKESFGMGLE
jgi:hypothetical protein